MADLSALFDDPELMQLLSELGIMDDESGLLMEQTARADQGRMAQMPQGRQAGGTFIASNPLEIAAATMERIEGRRGLKKATEGREALMGREREAMMRLARALRGGQAYAQPVQGYEDDWR